jgi:hypothetical protein
MNALAFYFASRSHLKFKFEFDSKEFDIIKGFVKRKGFSSLFSILGRILASGPTGQAFPCPSLFLHGPHRPSQSLHSRSTRTESESSSRRR